MMSTDPMLPEPPGEPLPLARPAHIPLARPVEDPQTADPMLLSRISRGRAALHLIVMFALVFAFLVLEALLTPPDQPDALPAGALAMTLVMSTSLIAVVFFLLRGTGAPAAALGWTTRGLGTNLPLGLLAVLFTFALFFGTIGIIWLVWPEGQQQMLNNPKNIDQLVPPWPPAALLGLMLLVAIYEETLFRGILLTHLRRLTGSWFVAVVLSSALFAALHVRSQELAVAIVLFPLAVLWSVTTIWRRSLIPAIIAHALFNWAQLMVLRYRLSLPS